jgi:hypothetical protein
LLGLWCLTPLSTIFQLYLGDHVFGRANRSIRTSSSTRRKPPTTFITQCCIQHTSPWAGFEPTTIVVIGTDCIDSCKSNYNTMAPVNVREAWHPFMLTELTYNQIWNILKGLIGINHLFKIDDTFHYNRFHHKLTGLLINIRDNRKDKQELTIQKNWQHWAHKTEDKDLKT